MACSPFSRHPKTDFLYYPSTLVSNRQTFAVPGLGLGITIVLDIYIPDIPMNAAWGSAYKTAKPIVCLGDSPRIYYSPFNNNLSLILKYKDNPYYSNYPEISCSDVKLQKWNKYIFVVDNRNVRIYLNGNIIRSQTIDGIPLIYDSTIVLGQKNNNFLGNIRQLDIYPYPVDYLDIDNL